MGEADTCSIYLNSSLIHKGHFIIKKSKISVSFSFQIVQSVDVELSSEQAVSQTIWCPPMKDLVHMAKFVIETEIMNVILNPRSCDTRRIIFSTS